MEFVLEEIGIKKSNNFEQGSGDGTLQFNDTPELRAGLSTILRDYYPSFAEDILNNDELHEVYLKIEYYLSETNSLIQKYDEFTGTMMTATSLNIMDLEHKVHELTAYAAYKGILLKQQLDHLLLARQKLWGAAITGESNPDVTSSTVI